MPIRFVSSRYNRRQEKSVGQPPPRGKEKRTLYAGVRPEGVELFDTLEGSVKYVLPAWQEGLAYQEQLINQKSKQFRLFGRRRTSEEIQKQRDEIDRKARKMLRLLEQKKWAEAADLIKDVTQTLTEKGRWATLGVVYTTAPPSQSQVYGVNLSALADLMGLATSIDPKLADLLMNNTSELQHTVYGSRTKAHEEIAKSFTPIVQYMLTDGLDIFVKDRRERNKLTSRNQAILRSIKEASSANDYESLYYYFLNLVDEKRLPGFLRDTLFINTYNIYSFPS